MFLYSKWTELPLNTRHTIAASLGIPKTGGIEVVSNRVVRDGYDIKNIETALHVDNLKKHLKTDEEDFDTLWGMLVNKAEGREPVLPVPDIDTTKPEFTSMAAQEAAASNGKEVSVTNLTPEEVQLEVTKGQRIVTTSFPKKKGGRPKGMRKVNGVWVKPDAPVM